MEKGEEEGPVERGEGPIAEMSTAVRQMILELVTEELAGFREEVDRKIAAVNLRLDQLSQRIDGRYY